MKHSIKREQSHARMSFAEFENQRSLAEGESNVRATLKHMKLSFNLILTIALWLMAAQTAWATDPVVKTFLLSSATRSDDYMSLLMNDPDYNNAQKTVVIADCDSKYARIVQGTSDGSGYKEIRNQRIGANDISAADVPVRISPYINGKVTKIEFTKMGRYATQLYNSSDESWSDGTFSMSIVGMKYNGMEDALTGNGTKDGYKLTEKESFTFISTNSEGIEGDIVIQLGAASRLILWNNCEIKITYIPSAAPVHAHDFTYTLVGNTLTATCGGTDGLECSLTNHQVSTSLNADDSFDSDPAMIFSATLTGFTFFSKETGATKGNITYVNNTTSENLGTTTPSDPGQYTASITITAGGTDYTLTKTYNVYSYAQINNIYPQLNISTDKYASTTAAGANETVTITFTSKFGETLTTLTVTGATTHNNVTLTQTGANTYTFIMPSENVTIGATFSISEDDFAETGTDEYTIKTANGWGWFCFATNYDLAPDGFSGKVVKLAGNVSSSEMAGKSGHPFKGTFDGQNYTLTFNLQASEGYSAPFHYTDGATISNLHVTGLIEGNDISPLAGLVGKATGNITISNCHVSTQISTTVSISAWHGGIIAFWDDSNVECTITGCVYDGLIYNPNEANVTSYCFGFIGNSYGSNMDITFTDCLFAPAEYTNDKKALREDYGSYTFVYPKSGLNFYVTNCYYTRNLGKRQGRPATTATTAPANLGAATTDHGMVKGYKNGFLYDGNYYTPKYGDVVVEYPFRDDNWEERADVTINGTNNQGTGVNVVGVNITEEVGNIKSVTYNRPFNTAQAATVILPFKYDCNGSEGGKFYSFAGFNGSTPIMEDGNQVTSLTANTPYLFVPTASKMTFPNIEHMTDGVTTLLPTTGEHEVTADDGNKLYGTYSAKIWKEGDSEIGKAYVYNDNGELVPVVVGTKIRPTECYFILGTNMINGVDITIPSKEYSGSAQTPEITVKAGETTLTLDTDYTVTAPSGDCVDAGDYIFTIKGIGNYSGETTVTFTIARKGVTVTAEDKTKEYGAADPELTATVAGLIGEDKITYTLSRAEGENAGEYAITAAGEAEQGNYSVTYAGAKFTITAANGAVTAPTAITGLEYNGKAQNLIAAGSSATGTIQYSLDGNTYAESIPQGTDAKEYTVYYKVAADANHKDVAAATLKVTIARKAATVTADDKTKEYGAADPELTATLAGLVGEDKIAYTLSRAEGENAGEYAITAAGEAEQGNYSVTYAGAKFTITAANGAVTAPTAITGLEYNGKAQNLIAAGSSTTGTIQYSLDGNTYAEAIPQGTDAKEYTVYYKVVADANHKDVAASTVKVTIARKAATVTADDKTKEYGAADPELTATMAGLIGEDKIAYTLARAEGEDAGEYAITASGETTQGNYSVTFVAGKFTITKPEPNTEVVNPDETVTVGGETFYEPKEETKEALKEHFDTDLALSAEAANSMTVNSNGEMEFKQGKNVNVAIPNKQQGDVMKFEFTGKMYGDSSKMRRKGVASTRSAGDMELISGAEYEVLETGSIVITVAAQEAPVTFKGISTTAAGATGIDSIQNSPQAADSWYDLNGRKVEKPTQKGIYIRNGQKIVIK